MKLYTIIPEEHILMDLQAATYLMAVEELLGVFQLHLSDAQLQSALETLTKLETDHPSIMEAGAAIPHARIDGLAEPMMALGLSQKGIPSPVKGGEPLHFLALILTPPERNTFMLQMMSAVSRLLLAEERRNAILQQRTPQRLIGYLKETEISVKKTLTVDDVMLSQYPTLGPEDLLDRATELLVRTKFRALPVVNEEGQLLGEITLGYLIRLALPDYIGIISNQNFLDSFDPFENYFVNERKRPVSEVMRLDCLRVKPDAPILEVGQMLIESGCRQIYVCRGQQLIGVIDAPTFVHHCLQL